MTPYSSQIDSPPPLLYDQRWTRTRESLIEAVTCLSYDPVSIITGYTVMLDNIFETDLPAGSKFYASIIGSESPLHLTLTPAHRSTAIHAARSKFKFCEGASTRWKLRLSSDARNGFHEQLCVKVIESGERRAVPLRQPGCRVVTDRDGTDNSDAMEVYDTMTYYHPERLMTDGIELKWDETRKMLFTRIGAPSEWLLAGHYDSVFEATRFAVTFGQIESHLRIDVMDTCPLDAAADDTEGDIQRIAQRTYANIVSNRIQYIRAHRRRADDPSQFEYLCDWTQYHSPHNDRWWKRSELPLSYVWFSTYHAIEESSDWYFSRDTYVECKDGETLRKWAENVSWTEFSTLGSKDMEGAFYEYIHGAHRSKEGVEFKCRRNEMIYRLCRVFFDPSYPVMVQLDGVARPIRFRLKRCIRQDKPGMGAYALLPRSFPYDRKDTLPEFDVPTLARMRD